MHMGAQHRRKGGLCGVITASLLAMVIAAVAALAVACGSEGPHCVVVERSASAPRAGQPTPAPHLSTPKPCEVKAW